MRVLIATDAWHPQVNGVVRTLTSLAKAAKGLGVEIEFLSPEGFPSTPLPTYPGLRLALPSRKRIAEGIEQVKPDAIHIATEGTIGLWVRAYCIRHGWPFTTSYTTRFPEYISARWPIPESLIYAALRRFHTAASVTMVATPSLKAELAARGFSNLGMWTRGVDTELFRPDRAIELPYPRPIFACVGRVAVEKNLEAFLSLDLPGTKMVIGTGPREADLKSRFPNAKFMGLIENGKLAAHLASADVFVFPSLTDTFGVVQLEALASGVPIAAFPVTGPKAVHINQAVDGANHGMVDVAADDAVDVLAAAFGAQGLLELSDEIDGVLDLELDPPRQRPVRQSQNAAHGVEISIQRDREIVGVVAEQRQPTGVADHHIEQIAVDDEKAPPVGRYMDGLIHHLDAAEMGAIVLTHELVMIARHVDHACAFARLAQQLLHHVVVRLRPVPSGLELPAINNVADQIDQVGVVVAQEIQELFGLAAPGPKMDVRDEQGPDPDGRIVAVRFERMAGDDVHAGPAVDFCWARTSTAMMLLK